MNRVSILLPRVAAVAPIMALSLAWLAVPAPTAAQEPITIEKYVAAVNDAAPPDPAAIALVPGDSITFGLSVSSVPSLSGTEVTITDVVDGNVLAFEGAVPTGCTESVGEVSCLVTLDDAGSTEVLLTFSVRSPASSASACQELVNTATVVGADDTSASTELAVEICPEGMTREGTAGSAPNTALELPRSPSGFAIQLGALLLGTAVMCALHGSARLPVHDPD